MDAIVYVSLAVGVVSLVSSTLGPAIIVGRYLGRVLTVQAQHEQTLERHSSGIADKGVRLEQLGRELSELRGELRGRGHLGADR